MCYFVLGSNATNYVERKARRKSYDRKICNECAGACPADGHQPAEGLRTGEGTGIPYDPHYPNEKTGRRSYQHDATAGEIPGGDCLGVWVLCEYSPLSYPPPPGTGRWQTLQKLRQTDLHVAGQKGKTVLLGSVPHDLVEQPPGTGSEESILLPHL